jgi:hypothetical protein
MRAVGIEVNHKEHKEHKRDGGVILQAVYRAAIVCSSIEPPHAFHLKNSPVYIVPLTASYHLDMRSIL